MNLCRTKILYQLWRQPHKIINNGLCKAMLLPMLLGFSQVTLADHGGDHGGGGLSYCSATSSNNTYESIGSVRVNGKNKYLEEYGPNYVYINSHEFVMSKGEQTSFNINPWFSEDDDIAPYQEYYGVWIDLDRNGTFESSERFMDTRTDSNA